MNTNADPNGGASPGIHSGEGGASIAKGGGQKKPFTTDSPELFRIEKTFLKHY
jgi:hypothetical protein